MPRTTDLTRSRDAPTTYAEAGLGRMIGAFCIDAMIMLGSPVALLLVLARTLGGGLATVAALIAWPLLALAYGAICGYGRTIGGLVTGTRRLLLPSGRAPGPWRMAWDCLKIYVFGVILILLIMLAEGSGNPVPDGTDPSDASNRTTIKDRVRTVRVRGR